MRSTVIAILILMHCTLSLAAEAGRPAGVNCALASPPDAAGEESDHGFTLRIYPRARDIGASYTGCQTMWAPDKGKWFVVSIIEIEEGDPKRIWSPDDPTGGHQACRYKNGKVIAGNADECPAPEFLIAKSLAPGCVAKLRQSVAQHGMGTPWPPGCSYE
jgi:hypothetical protein